MNRHGYTKRIGVPGEDLWECQSCKDRGPFYELMARECPHHTSQAEAIRNVLKAIGLPDLMAALIESGMKKQACAKCGRTFLTRKETSLCPPCREEPPFIGIESLPFNQHPFNQHLDTCAQCQDNPFNLCPEGARLLQEST
jgi:hypothetical protein